MVSLLHGFENQISIIIYYEDKFVQPLTYFQHQYIIELKRWYGAKAHQKGLDQLAEYLEIHSKKEGFLVIFDNRKTKTWASNPIQHQEKKKKLFLPFGYRFITYLFKLI